MLATAKIASPKTQKCLKPHGTSGFRHYSPNGHCIKDGVNIDPPYNTGAAFEHYDDNVSHATWLSLMYPRLELLRELLADNGSIWISIDDTECHYLKVICDEIFGRENFIAGIIWEKADSPKMDAKLLSSRHDHILLYTKNIELFSIKKITSIEIPKHYNKTDDNGRRYYLKPLRAMGVDGYREKRPALYFPIQAPDGQMVYPKNQDGTDSRWRWSKEKVEKDKSLLEWINGKNGWSLYFRIYWDNSDGTPPETLWKQEDVGSNRTSKKEVKDLFKIDIFATPKPERLIQHILTLATNPGDIVLDSFLGSGTTAAVAQKMNRRYIGIEIGEHAVTHVVPRLKKVIDGEEGGISKAENWQGGGGFSFFRLGEEIFTADGRIQKGVDFKTLAAHIWMEATRTPYKRSDLKDTADSPLLGVYKDTAYYLLYNGILGDKRPQGGNVLTKKILSILPPFNGLRIIYGESSRICPENLKAMNIIFRQTPKEIPAN